MITLFQNLDLCIFFYISHWKGLGLRLSVNRPISAPTQDLPMLCFPKFNSSSNNPLSRDVTTKFLTLCCEGSYGDKNQLILFENICFVFTRPSFHRPEIFLGSTHVCPSNDTPFGLSKNYGGSWRLETVGGWYICPMRTKEQLDVGWLSGEGLRLNIS